MRAANASEGLMMEVKHPASDAPDLELGKKEEKESELHQRKAPQGNKAESHLKRKPAKRRHKEDNRDMNNNTAFNRAIAQVVRKFGVRSLETLGELYPLLIRPIGAGFGGFITDENGEYDLTQPFKDILMIPGNLLMTAGDLVLPINEKGRWGLPPFVTSKTVPFHLNVYSFS